MANNNMWIVYKEGATSGKRYYVGQDIWMHNIFSSREEDAEKMPMARARALAKELGGRYCKAQMPLTFAEFIELAKAHYNQGGDSYVECWDERTFSEWEKNIGIITKPMALRWFKEEKDHQRDVAGYWKM